MNQGKDDSADASRRPTPKRPVLDLAFALSSERRAEFLEEANASGDIPRKELQTTLGIAEVLPDPATTVDDLKRGTMIGHYKILEKIGEGASANVYMVEQLEPVRRRLALKILKLGMDTGEVMARFDAEKQALAMMEHPNIARVFDAGATPSGRPYFVMELVKGVPITVYCDKNHLLPQQRLELLMAVCHAVQHAHVKGVIHRDLKPNNILVTLHDGAPVPKVIDFGIAKATESRLTDQTLFTKFQQFVGTPAYMSPEQAEMSGLDIDTRSDVYSLGVMLYELLAGSTPFKTRELLAAGYDKLRKIIAEEDPPLPSTRLSSLGKEGLTIVAKHRRLEPGALSSQVKGELDWIVMKALDKDRVRRYQGAEALAQDLQAYIDDEPVSAGPPNKLYRLRKFMRRHRVPVMAVAVVVLSLFGGAIISTYGWRQAEQRADDARLQAKRADTVSDLLFEMFESAEPGSNKGRHYTVSQLLDDFGQELQDQLDREPEVEYSVRQVLARAYEGLGKYLESEQHWRRSRGLALEIYGPESAAVMSADVRIGWVLHEMGHLEESRKLIESSLVKQQGLLGTEHEDCLETQTLLVEVRRRNGELEKAEQLAKETIARYETQGHRPKKQSLWLRQTLAQIYRDQGKLEEAERLAHQVVASSSQRHGDDNPVTLKAIHTLSQTYLDGGRLKDGERLVQRGLERARRSLGDLHPTTLTLQSDLASFYQAQGDYDKAAQEWEAVFAKRKETLGEEHADTLRTMLDLAEHYRLAEKLTKAENLVKGAKKTSQDQLGEMHALTLDSVAAYLQLLIEQQNYDGAEDLAKTSFEKTHNSLGASHPRTLQAQIIFADVTHGLTTLSQE